MTTRDRATAIKPLASTYSKTFLNKHVGFALMQDYKQVHGLLNALRAFKMDLIEQLAAYQASKQTKEPKEYQIAKNKWVSYYENPLEVKEAALRTRSSSSIIERLRPKKVSKQDIDAKQPGKFTIEKQAAKQIVFNPLVISINKVIAGLRAFESVIIVCDQVDALLLPVEKINIAQDDKRTVIVYAGGPDEARAKINAPTEALREGSIIFYREQHLKSIEPLIANTGKEIAAARKRLKGYGNKSVAFEVSDWFDQCLLQAKMLTTGVSSEFIKTYVVNIERIFNESLVPKIESNRLASVPDALLRLLVKFEALLNSKVETLRLEFQYARDKYEEINLRLALSDQIKAGFDAKEKEGRTDFDAMAFFADASPIKDKVHQSAVALGRIHLEIDGELPVSEVQSRMQRVMAELRRVECGSDKFRVFQAYLEDSRTHALQKMQTFYDVLSPKDLEKKPVARPVLGLDDGVSGSSLSGIAGAGSASNPHRLMPQAAQKKKDAETQVAPAGAHELDKSESILASLLDMI